MKGSNNRALRCEPPLLHSTAPGGCPSILAPSEVKSPILQPRRLRLRGLSGQKRCLPRRILISSGVTCNRDSDTQGHTQMGGMGQNRERLKPVHQSKSNLSRASPGDNTAPGTLVAFDLPTSP